MVFVIGRRSADLAPVRSPVDRSPLQCPLDMSERYSSPKIVLLYTGVAPLGVRVTGVTARDVHADHVPQFTLERPSVVTWGPSWGVRNRLWLHHGHHWTSLLGAVTVGHGAVTRDHKSCH